MPKTVARSVLMVAVMLGAVACGEGASATFNADGSVTVGLKFLFPKSLMQGSTGASVSGFTAADISNANAALAKKYPGAKIATVTEGDETGAEMTIPFKTEKDAFAFMTAPSQLNPAASTSGSAGVDLSNTGGMFASAAHTTDGSTDTYTFKTQPTPLPSPSPGDVSSPVTIDELTSIFTITFSLTVPHEITSAPGALFTLDRKTAIWKLSWTQAQTLTATTGAGGGVAGLGTGQAGGQSPVLVVVVALVAVALGFAAGMFQPWRRVGSSVVVPAAGPALEPPLAMEQPGGVQGPPPGEPPPTNPPHS